MGRKGSANGTTRASGLVNGADVSDAVKESETAMFGRPKKLKKGRNRRDQSSDEDTAPLAAAKRLAATVSEEVDGATEKSSINQTRSQKRKQKKERKDIGGKGRTFHGSDDDDVLTLAALANSSADEMSEEDEKSRNKINKKSKPKKVGQVKFGFAALMGAATDEDKSENSDGDGEVDVSTASFSGLSDKRGSATNFAALLDNSDDDEKSAHEEGPRPGIRQRSLSLG